MIILRPLCSLLTPALPCEETTTPVPHRSSTTRGTSLPLPWFIPCHLGIPYSLPIATSDFLIPGHYRYPPGITRHPPLSNTSASQPGIGFLSNQSVVEWLAWFRNPYYKTCGIQTAGNFIQVRPRIFRVYRRGLPLSHLYMCRNVVFHMGYKWVAANTSMTHGRFERGDNRFVSEWGALYNIPELLYGHHHSKSY